MPQRANAPSGDTAILKTGRGGLRMKRDGEAEAAPVVSVIMANHNGAAFLEAAMKSVLEQTLQALELIIVDDGSTDQSRTLITRQAELDARVRLIARAQAGGPGRARNAGLDSARGEFIAIVDSDDLMHPGRLARLVAHAKADRAGIVADDIMVFAADGGAAPRRLLRGALAREAQWLDLEAFVDANHLYGKGPILGVLKPLIARDILDRTGVRYDERLRIGEDYDFLAQLLEQGYYMRLYPELGYFYRKHAASISHRLDVGALEELRVNACAWMARAPSADLRARHKRRLRSITRAMAYEELVARAKSGGLAGLVAHAWRARAGLSLLRLPLMARVERLGLRARRQAPELVVLSHQRVVGAVNGSSRYLLDLCQEWRRAGVRVRLVQSSSAVFGRWPVLWLSRDTDVFEQIEIRGAWSIGRLRLARSPAVWARAMAAIAERALLKARLLRKPRLRPAPSALMAEQGAGELLFAARHAQGARIIVADYAFLAPMLCAALDPLCVRAVIMHDLLSARRADFDAQGAADSSATLSRAEELALLEHGDAIIAIQAHEAREVAQAAPHKKVILAPLAVRTIHAPHPGHANELLFVGSNTAANRIGLEYFFAEVWPRLQQMSGGPALRLTIAGSVGRGLNQKLPSGVRVLGVVKDLTPLYRRAGLVISPLTLGSGLKIKLIEAMAHAKAVVASPVTMQGVEAELSEAVVVARDADAFAAEIMRLALDDVARLALARAAAVAVARLFAPEICYRALIELVAARKDDPVRSVQHARS